MSKNQNPNLAMTLQDDLDLEIIKGPIYCRFTQHVEVCSPWAWTVARRERLQQAFSDHMVVFFREPFFY